MFSLLLTILFMTESIKIENPQQQFVPIERAETISGIGYTQRPINQRKQVINTYLDVIRINGSFEVNTMSLYDITDVTITKLSGNYLWNKDTTPLKLYIPVMGTYQISGRIFISSSIGVGLMSTFIQVNGGSNTEVFSAMAVHGITIPITWTVNLNKGDYLNIYIDNESSNTVEGSLQLTITKIS